MERTGASGAREVGLRSLDQSAPARVVGATRPNRPVIEELSKAAEQEAHKRPEVVRLMTHPGVGFLTALAYVLIIGTPERFHCGKQIGTYVGMVPSEESSGDK